MRIFGVDTTDPFAKHPRDAAVAEIDDTLCLKNLYEKPMEAVSYLPWAFVAIDGPQGLAKLGAKHRECERLLRTPGRTPDTLPLAGSKPFAGYLRGNILLFASMLRQGWRLQENLIEVFPGAAWPLFSPVRLMAKQVEKGRQQRREILVRCGIQGLPQSLNHDQLDAIMAAYTAFQFSTGKAVLVGLPWYQDGIQYPGQGEFIREGFIVQPRALEPQGELPGLEAGPGPSPDDAGGPEGPG